MRALSVLSIFIALCMADAMSIKMLVSLLRNSDDAIVPHYTQEELDNARRVEFDITDLGDLLHYKSSMYLSTCRRVERRVLSPPPNHFFSTILADGETIYVPTKFLGYKIIVDVVEGVPTYVRIDGFRSAGVVASRYFYKNEEDIWEMVQRNDFVRRRVTDGNRYAVNIKDSIDAHRKDGIVRETKGTAGTIVTLYPKFNMYITEVKADDRVLWHFDPVQADLVLKIMLYTYKGSNFCSITTMDCRGTSIDRLYAEDTYGYNLISHSRHGFFGGRTRNAYNRKPGESFDPEVLNYKPPKPRHTPVGEATEERRQLFAGAKLIKCNFRRNPDLLLEEGWTLDVKGHPNGDYERIFAPKGGYLIYKLVDHDRYVWDFEGYGVTSGHHLITYDGNQFLRLEVVNEKGECFEHYYLKIDENWELIEKSVWDQRTVSRLSYSLFGADGILTGRDLSEEELGKVKDNVAVDLDISKVVNYAWSTERSTVSGVMTRKVYTAVDGYCFKSFSEDGETFFKPSGDFVVTKAVHYKVEGLDLVSYLAHDTTDGVHSVHHFMKHKGKWIEVSERAYKETIAVMLTLTEKHAADRRGSVTEVSTEEDLKPGAFYPNNPYSELQEALNIPQDPLIDGHRGGLMLPLPPNEEHLKRVCESEGINLEIHEHSDNRYDVSAFPTGKGITRVIYKVSDGYHFKAVSDSGVPVFQDSGYTMSEAVLDKMEDGENFLQVRAFDGDGKEHVFYYYKQDMHKNLQEISRKTYLKQRFRSFERVYVDLGMAVKDNEQFVKLQSKHFKNVISFLPRMNVLVDTIKHDNYIIWKYDERKPEVITRIVTFVREGIRGCSITLVDEDGRETERLYLNTNPRTNEYTLFLHKGEMFSLFKNYLRNRKIGFAWNVRYLPDEINWTEIVEPGSKDYAMCQPGYKMSANGECEDDEESVEELAYSEDEEESVDEAEPDTNAGLTEEQKARRAAMAQKRKQQEHIADKIYYSEKKFAMQYILHKEGAVWDSKNTGDLCLDIRKHNNGRYRIIECEIMSPDGHVELRYFVNNANGKGDYREFNPSDFGSDL
ncbi:hypothetical protein BgAZ_501310 [Babesia gibsoni]|uniref:Spherical body protein 3 n=1 Tax=Babesia gibsoni TaxID=33632 RepID=A0AAD8PCS4_BABGI|nr:hypothetical protein BgAZ_501310 [Babesia gibsoni]